MTALLRLVLPGAPRTKKNRGKIWKAGNRTIIRPAEPWLQWRDSLLAEKHESRWPEPKLAVSLNCTAFFYRDRNAGDAVGYYQGLADVLEELGVVVNDRLIEQWDGSRLRIDRTNPRVELTLTPV